MDRCFDFINAHVERIQNYNYKIIKCIIKLIFILNKFRFVSFLAKKLVDVKVISKVCNYIAFLF